MLKKKLLTLGMAVLVAISASAQIKIKGVLANARYDDGDTYKTDYVGWNSELQKAIFIVDNGIYSMTWDGNTNTLSTPTKEPPTVKSEIAGNNEKEVWANNFNMMVGNSGSVYVDGKIVTIMSRDYQSVEDDELFAVRKWDAKTGDLLTRGDRYFDVSRNLESAGLSYNPIDGKVYGFFHVTNAQLSQEILTDPDFTVDEDDTDWGREGLDDGYALGTIDLQTMQIKLITPGYYYDNFVTFAINSLGQGFVLTSGGVRAAEGADGKLYDIDNKLTGSQIYEVDLKTGLLKRNATVIHAGTDSAYVQYTPIYAATGYASQAKRQAACFAKSNPYKMYWVGYFNSGKGINDWGSNSSLSDKEWRTNGKYDTALYEIDLMTGECKRLAKIDNRMTFSCLWIEGDDNSDGAGIEIIDPSDLKTADDNTVPLTYIFDGDNTIRTSISKGETRLSIYPKDGWKVAEILVNGTSRLDGYKDYKLTIDVQVDTEIRIAYAWADEANLYTEDTNGIVTIAEENVKVQAKDGQIRVSGAAGKTVRLFTIGGSLITTVVPSENGDGLLTVGQGTYIVQIGKKAAKVNIR